MGENRSAGALDEGPDIDLGGRLALITGGGSGLGLAMAHEFARRGAELALIGRDAARLQRAAGELAKVGARTSLFALDVRDRHAVRRAVRDLESARGPVDILVNNAAGNFVRPAEEIPERAFANLIDIVLNGTFNCTRAVARSMIARRGGGVILNVVATYAWTGGPGTVHSACAKAGVLAMTRTLAVEWARHRIRVVAVAPGPFESSGAADRLWPSDELEQRVRATVPLGRFATREEVARAATWLVSDDAAYVTGECLTIDGGAWLGRGILGADEPIPKVRRRRRPHLAFPRPTDTGESPCVAQSCCCSASRCSRPRKRPIARRVGCSLRARWSTPATVWWPPRTRSPSVSASTSWSGAAARWTRRSPSTPRSVFSNRWPTGSAATSSPSSGTPKAGSSTG
jgi:NAD(P)-dependent dehydrogenase (short-subunit alcohol dehydrogenase family)